jgi:hypothetical protein
METEGPGGEGGEADVSLDQLIHFPSFLIAETDHSIPLVRSKSRHRQSPARRHLRQTNPNDPIPNPSPSGRLSPLRDQEPRGLPARAGGESRGHLEGIGGCAGEAEGG